MNKPLTARGQQRRQAFLEAATDSFLEHGYAGTTLDMIIQRAGGSRRSLYEYFGDKGGLFTAVMAHHTAGMMSVLQQSGAESLPAAEGLQRLARVFVDVLISPLYLELYRQLIAQGPQFPALAKQIYDGGPAQVIRRLHLYLQWLVDRGEFPAHRLNEHTARQFLGMIKADFQVCALLAPDNLPEPARIDAHIADCVRILLDDR